jgi:hypothetical protein
MSRQNPICPVLFKHLILANTVAGSWVSGWTFLKSIAFWSVTEQSVHNWNKLNLFYGLLYDLYFQNRSKWQHSMILKWRLGMMSCIWHHRLVIMILFTYLCSKICLLLNTPAPVGSRHWGAGVIYAGSRWGYLKKFPK